ncbi:hypothetical protein EM59_016440 [Vibrio parahaemolyticus]|uniref:hypothetical protein n=1 Tax=Vibrio parahaemolyticus TaxID=670 RepID=UPI0004D8DC09|nr:hypothetical protein [Vibrio parahaemolyticus]EGQ9979470.1 hypothetical protein [Vibrio parahaemolyticus]ELB2744109.1 hypothetical protein [Vibrio parahaemolyticus]OQU35724.1 hypothetical protein EM59_016440 [Vibrio parahaemolyticus]
MTVMNNTNVITVLETDGYATKVHQPIETKGFSLGRYFKPSLMEVNSIYELGALLYDLENESNKFIVGGHLKCLPAIRDNLISNKMIKPRHQPSSLLADRGWVINRIKELSSGTHPLSGGEIDKTLLAGTIEAVRRYDYQNHWNINDYLYWTRWLLVDNEVPCFHNDNQRQWVCLDLDGITAESLMNDVGTADAVNEIIEKHLPEIFHDATCWYQWSSSAALKRSRKKPKANIHLWFWLDKPYWHSELQKMFSQMKRGHQKIDVSLFRPVQPHYTAKPVFEGLHDPLRGKRSGLIEKTNEVVEMKDWHISHKPHDELFGKRYGLCEVTHDDLIRQQIAAVTMEPRKKLTTKQVGCTYLLKAKADYLSKGGKGNNRGSMACAMCIEAFKRGYTVQECFDWLESINYDGARTPDRIVEWSFIKAEADMKREEQLEELLEQNKKRSLNDVLREMKGCHEKHEQI